MSHTMDYFGGLPCNWSFNENELQKKGGRGGNALLESWAHAPTIFFLFQPSFEKQELIKI